MKSLGEVLRTYRTKNQLTLDTLARHTSIPLATLEHLENEEYDQLPAAPLVRGYLQLIARELHLPEETALALFRRDVEPRFTASKNTNHGRERWQWPVRQSLLSPRFLSLAGLLFIFIGGVGWLGWQWQRLSRPPLLEVTSPQNALVTQSPVVVEGKTNPDNTVTVNTEVVALDPQGNFRTELALPPGERTLVILTTDSHGRTSEKILFLTVE